MNRLISDRETATILAALRFWRREGLLSAGHEHDLASDGDRHPPLSMQEIDALCERLNGGDASGPGDSTSDFYRVTWMIDLAAKSPQEAATRARATQLDRNTLATIFTVQRRGGTALCIDTDDLAALAALTDETPRPSATQRNL